MFGPTVSPQLVQSGKGRIASDPALLNLPRPPTRLGPFSVHGSGKQMFGADKQVPKGGCGLCPKNASGPGNSVRDILIFAGGSLSADGDGGRRSAEPSGGDSRTSVLSNLASASDTFQVEGRIGQCLQHCLQRSTRQRHLLRHISRLWPPCLSRGA